MEEDKRPAAKGNPNSSLSKCDSECPICFNIMVEPYRTICGHVFCMNCYKEFMRHKASCPMCRKTFEILFTPRIDADLKNLIQDKYPEQFEQRLSELQDLGLLCGNKIMIHFAFGNLHELIKQPQLTTGGKQTNTHAWTMFVALNQAKALTGEIIKSVTYDLHETFYPKEVLVSSYPFICRRIGWGYFDVEIKIGFQPWTKIKTKKLTHRLSFDDNGKSCGFIEEIDLKDFESSDKMKLHDSLMAEMSG